MAASNARIGVAVAEYYPKLSLSGLIGSATSMAGGNLFTGGANQAAGVLGLRWCLFDFGRINAQIQQAKGQRPTSGNAGRVSKGVVSLIEGLQADESLLRAADERAQAQTESVRAAVAAFRALGGGWQPSKPDAVAVR
ncbi:TolC family protein [Dyella flagellata]|uniref:Outer membrane efflux protein n=1 Tax=Dyella flagellata TaxID=1867833 RepID=A0ABQ5X9W6_9GAMM|nr:hypothetical protein GCM10007898_12590 [Dyella flagellata]